MAELPVVALPITFAGGQAIAAEDGFVVLPNGLQLALGADGRPDFRFDVIRRDDRSADIYGVLSFRVEALFPDDKAVAAFRSAHGGASARPVAFTAGFLRLVATGTQTLPAQLLVPQPLSCDELGRASFRLRLDTSTTGLVGGLLENGTLPVLAFAEMEYAVRIPPLPVTAEFDPAALTAALAPDSGNRLVGGDDLVVRLRAMRSTLPIRWGGAPEDCAPDRLAAALAAWIRLHLGSFVPAPTTEGQGYLKLDDVAPGRVGCDLTQGVEWRKVACLSLNPFSALQQLGDTPPINRVSVPSAVLGRYAVAVSALMPEGTNVGLGVALMAPPDPPRRPSVAMTELVRLSQPTYSASTQLRLSAAEPLAYTFTTHVNFPNGWVSDSTLRPCPTNPARLDLGPDDFPARFLTVLLDPALASTASLTGTAQWADGKLDFALAEGAAASTLCLPRDATEGGLTLTLTPRDGVGRAITVTRNLCSCRLSPAYLPGFGPHSQIATCTFPDGFREALLLDIASEANETPIAVRLSPSAPEVEFTWYADSAFRPGYRFRRHGRGGWSPPRPVSAPLVLRIDPATSALSTQDR